MFYFIDLYVIQHRHTFNEKASPIAEDITNINLFLIKTNISFQCFSKHNSSRYFQFIVPYSHIVLTDNKNDYRFNFSIDLLIPNGFEF